MDIGTGARNEKEIGDRDFSFQKLNKVAFPCMFQNFDYKTSSVFFSVSLFDVHSSHFLIG